MDSACVIHRKTYLYCRWLAVKHKYILHDVARLERHRTKVYTDFVVAHAERVADFDQHQPMFTSSVGNETSYIWRAHKRLAR